MTGLVVDARWIDWIVGMVAVEAVLVLAWRARFGSGPAPAPFIINLLSGAFLLLALRNAMAGASSTWVASCLLTALVAHFADLTSRWNVSPPRKLKADQRPAPRAQTDEAVNG